MKKILFCCYGGGHVQTLLPLIEKFRLESQYEVKVFGLTIAGQVLRHHKIDYFSYKNLSLLNKENVQYLGNQFLHTLSLKKIDVEETIAYLGSNMQELINTYGKEEAESLYQQKGRACFYPLQLMTQLLLKETPDLVVATNSPRSEKAMIQAASNLNIPALCLIDGFAVHEAKWIASPSFGQYVGVISKSVKENFIKKGRPKESLYVIGNPAFDPFLIPNSSEEICAIKSNLLITNNQKVIMYASSPQGSQHIYTGKPADPLLPEKILNKLISIVKEHKDLFLIIRPHPSQEFKLNISSKNIFYDNGNDLKLMLSLSDLIITLGSTVGIQAQLLKKPLICCNQSVYANDIFYEDFGLVERIYDLEEIEAAIHKSLNGTKDVVFKNHQKQGSATEKTSQLIKKILNTKR